MEGRPVSQTKKNLLRAEEIRALPEMEGHHPLNPRSHIHLRTISGELGLQRLGVHLARIPPGKEANEVHTHHFEEEFYYILSGRGVALIDGAEHEIGPGDFLAFPTPSVPHLLTNPFEADLVYLVGGERREFEFADFPRHGKVLIRDRDKVYMARREDLEELYWKKPEA
jgi:uncharacterized cupin superfamily protein